MASTLLDLVIGGQSKRPFVRKTWVDRNTTKRAYRIKAIDTPAFYKPIGSVLFGDSFQPMYGIHTGTQHLALRGNAVNFVNSTGYNVSSNPLVASTDGNSWVGKNLPAGLTYSGLTTFNNQIWVYSRTALYVSTDLNGTSWSTSVNSPTGSGNLRPIVFGSRVVTAPGTSSSAIYSNANATSFTTHTLPVTMQVTGMATDGTTLMIVGFVSPTIGYVYKTTDLTNYTLVSVKMTSNDVEMSGYAGSTTSTTPFVPLGITYNGSTFVIIATDVMAAGGAVNSYFVGSYRIFNGSSSGPFLAKGEIRSDYMSIGYSNKLLFSNIYNAQVKSGNFITSDSSGRIAVALGLHTTNAYNTSLMYSVGVVIAYSDDNGETWTVSELPARHQSDGFTADLMYVPCSIYSSPNGFVAFFAGYGANAPDFYMSTNVNARELAMPY